MVSSPFIGFSNQSVMQSPFGSGIATMNGGPGSVQMGPMGIATSLTGPMPITAANTVNRLGLASPFAQPFGTFNPIQPNSFGAVNPFSPMQATTFDGFDSSPFGSFGPSPNPLSPLSWQGGTTSMLNPGFTSGGFSPVSAGNMMAAAFSPTQGLGQLVGQPIQQFQQPVFQQQQGFFQRPVQQFQQPVQFQAPVSLPRTSSFFDFLNTGGGSFLVGQSAPQNFIQQPVLQQGFFQQPVQQFQQPIQSLGFNQTPIQQGFQPGFGQVNPFGQQLAFQGGMPGAGGRLVTPFGTFTTSIGPMGGNANAGFLGAQAAGQAFAMVQSPINPGIIVDYANPFYSSANFNQGFFAA